jgi:hypothetical protein
LWVEWIGLEICCHSFFQLFVFVFQYVHDLFWSEITRYYSTICTYVRHLYVYRQLSVIDKITVHYSFISRVFANGGISGKYYSLIFNVVIDNYCKQTWIDLTFLSLFPRRNHFFKAIYLTFSVNVCKRDGFSTGVDPVLDNVHLGNIFSASSYSKRLKLIASQ